MFLHDAGELPAANRVIHGRVSGPQSVSRPKGQLIHKCAGKHVLLIDPSYRPFQIVLAGNPHACQVVQFLAEGVIGHKRKAACHAPREGHLQRLVFRVPHILVGIAQARVLRKWLQGLRDRPHKVRKWESGQQPREHSLHLRKHGCILNPRAADQSAVQHRSERKILQGDLVGIGSGYARARQIVANRAGVGKAHRRTRRQRALDVQAPVLVLRRLSAGLRVRPYQRLRGTRPQPHRIGSAANGSRRNNVARAVAGVDERRCGRVTGIAAVP